MVFGIDADKIDDKRIWEVLEEAQLKEFIEELPEELRIFHLINNIAFFNGI